MPPGEKGRHCSSSTGNRESSPRERSPRDRNRRVHDNRSRSAYRSFSVDSDDRRRNKQRHSSSRSATQRTNRRSTVTDRASDVIPITGDDASFILGVGGRTKRKLSRVCGAELNVTERDGQTVLEIKGSPEALEKARLYVDFVMQQRIGPVELKVRPEDRTDMTLMEVPHECVGYVTGRKGQGLRSVEEEWNTLMFFTNLTKNGTAEKERLALFGTERARRGSELKVMSAVEQKMPGFVKQPDGEKISDEPGFATDIVPINDADYSYALGSKGATRKKLARASGAIIEYVGRFAYIAGNKAERERGRQYLEWLIAQRVSQVRVCVDDRNDALVVKLRPETVAYVTGTKGNNLRRVEDQTDTFIFLDSEGRDSNYERLLIFGYSEDNRKRAARLINERVEEKLTRRSRDWELYDDGRYNRRRYDYRSRSRDESSDRYTQPRRDRDRDRDRDGEGAEYRNSTRYNSSRSPPRRRNKSPTNTSPRRRTQRSRSR